MSTEKVYLVRVTYTKYVLATSDEEAFEKAHHEAGLHTTDSTEDEIIFTRPYFGKTDSLKVTPK